MRLSNSVVEDRCGLLQASRLPAPVPQRSTMSELMASRWPRHH